MFQLNFVCLGGMMLSEVRNMLKDLSREALNLVLEFRDEILRGLCARWTDSKYAFKFCETPAGKEIKGQRGAFC